MRFVQPQFKSCTKEAFVDFWRCRYDVSAEHLYRDNIDEVKTEQVILNLFMWKNSGKLSAKKLRGVKEKYKPFNKVRKRLTRLYDDDALLSELTSRESVIWDVFWLHCQDPLEFPIYDQHTHRAVMYIRADTDDLEIPEYNKRKARAYVEVFRPFLKEFASNPTICEARRIDQALFAFGKFLKGIDVRSWAGAEVINYS